MYALYAEYMQLQLACRDSVPSLIRASQKSHRDAVMIPDTPYASLVAINSCELSRKQNALALGKNMKLEARVDLFRPLLTPVHVGCPRAASSPHRLGALSRSRTSSY